MDNARYGQICPGNWLALYKKLPPAIIMDYLLFPIFLMPLQNEYFVVGGYRGWSAQDILNCVSPSKGQQI